MPGFPVLCTIQPIIGGDMHKAIPPPPPAPPPFVPHVIVWGVGLSQKSSFQWAVATSKASTPESGVMKPVAVGCGHAVGRTHDAGPHPGHIWPNVLLPLIMLGSASKSEFGAGTVKVATAAGGLDMAVNVAYVMNLNLDCWDFPFPPTPSGMAITIHYNVLAGFGLSDFFRGLVQTLVDMAISWAVGAACSILTGAISGLFSRAAGQSVLGAMGQGIKANFSVQTAKVLMNDGAGFVTSSGRLFIDGWRAALPAMKNAWRNAPADQALGIAGGGLSTFGFGTPTGYSPGYTPVGGGDKTVLGTRSVSTVANNWVDGLFR